MKHDTPEVLLMGNPNAGKTTLFNRLAGTRARTGNYPGVTVDRRTAKVDLGQGERLLVDVPGTYSLTASSPEEQIAATSLWRASADSVAIVVVDACALARGLYLVMQVIETGQPMVVALNMMDEARGRKIEIDVEGLETALGVPVVPLVASSGEGVPQLKVALRKARAGIPGEPVLPPPLVAALEELTELAANAEPNAEPNNRRHRAMASWVLLSLSEQAGEEAKIEVAPALREAGLRLQKELREAGIDTDEALIASHYQRIDPLVARLVTPGEEGPTWSEKVDDILTHPLWGLLIFAVVMLVLFEALFAWSDPMIGLVEGGVASLQTLVRHTLPAGLFTDLVADGIIAGVGNVVVFVPQIALLFLLIAILEDSGYLARVAFVIDRLMKAVGLHGKAFVPLLSGFACAIPAVMATRTISNRRDRLVTMLALPLMSCSARLPVYVLITAAVFAPDLTVGFMSIGAVVLFSMYALSVVATLGVAAILRRTVLKGPTPALVLELPPYRRPLLRNLLGATWTRVRSFLVDAGTIILALTIVLWALLSFPKSDRIAEEAQRSRDEAQATLERAEQVERCTTDQQENFDAQLAAIASREAAEQLEHSYAGRLGKSIEPVLEPLGMDWRIGIGVIGAFAAREVFVSTLGVVFGISDADEESEPLRESLRSAVRADGSPLMTPLSGIALLVFFVLAAQCMSTLAVVKRESGGWKWPVFMLVYMTALAYGAALLVFQVGSAFGWGTG